MAKKLHSAIKEDRRVHKRPSGIKLYRDEVWGAYDLESHEMVSKGMIVANSSETCPIFGDIVPYKSVTIVFDSKIHNEDEVIYWLRYVHGGEYSDYLELKDGRIAIRSDYQCW